MKWGDFHMKRLLLILLTFSLLLSASLTSCQKNTDSNIDTTLPPETSFCHQLFQARMVLHHQYRWSYHPSIED